MSFISFEGIDGSGKSTQIKLLEQKLLKKNISYKIYREPGGDKVSEKIRNILLDKELAISDISETMLFLAARGQLVTSNILENLNQGIFVICDRFSDSTVAYQGYGKKINIELIKLCNKFVTNSLKPKLTILMKIDYKTAISRLGIKKDRMENNSRIFFNNVINGYQDISFNEPDRFFIVDANLPEADIHNMIWQRIQKDFFI